MIVKKMQLYEVKFILSSSETRNSNRVWRHFAQYSMGPNCTVWADLYPQLMEFQSELITP